MKKQLLLATALSLSLLVFSGCAGGKTNGDGSESQSGPTAHSASTSAEEPEASADGVSSAVQEPGNTAEPVETGPLMAGENGEPLDKETKELCMAAVNYYEASAGYRAGMVRIDSVDEEGITLQLYDDMGDHVTTCAWYCIDPMTLEGYDLITGEEIAFYSYMEEEMKQT